MLSPLKSSSPLPATPQTWHARLDLCFSPNPNKPGQTLVKSQHEGPLRMQKALYPEGDDLCHVIVVHPPGGIAAGDWLTIQATVDANSAALLTTPGATRWYGSAGGAARQRVHLALDGDCEWLPMETIVFDQAIADSEVIIDCSSQARMMGWDALIFGRQSSGEDFSRGLFRQSISCSLDGRLCWEERTRAQGDDEIFASVMGMQGHRACGVLWAIRDAQNPWTEDELTGLRQAIPQLAWSVLAPRLLVGRQLGDAVRIREHHQAAWAYLRPIVFGRPPIAPRIWAT